MFGAYRYVLALLVMFGHLVPFFDGAWNWLGVYAVFSFFSLSGYLMTRILHERYGFAGRDLARYLANRALRIYPAYWAAMLAALALAVVAPDAARLLDDRIGVPGLGDWPRHLALLGLHWQVFPVLIPPAWSLHVEVAFYLLMGLGLARTRLTVTIWVLAAATYTAWTVAAGWEAGRRFPTVPAGGLPFALGAAAYFLRGRWRPAPAARAVLVAIVTVNALGAARLWSDAERFLAGFYLHTLLGAALVYALAQIDVRARPAWLQALDRRAGDLAYPIFLLHYPVAIAVVAFVFAGVRPPGWWLFWTALPAVNLVAWLAHRAVEAPVEPLRQRLRAR